MFKMLQAHYKEWQKQKRNPTILLQGLQEIFSKQVYLQSLCKRNYQHDHYTHKRKLWHPEYCTGAEDFMHHGDQAYKKCGKMYTKTVSYSDGQRIRSGRDAYIHRKQEAVVLDSICDEKGHQR